MLNVLYSYLQLCIVSTVVAFVVCPEIDEEVHPIRELIFNLAILPLMPIIIIGVLIIRWIKL